jgi:hypothetical protein
MVNNTNNTYMNGAQEIVDFFRGEVENTQGIVLENVSC